jgi:NodT family efflux transporter outer membrane factor (OMF) lipoprotein
MALAACAGPAIRTAHVDPVSPPPIWRTDPGAAAPVTADWWRSFNDTVLTSLVQEALAKNDDIGIAVGRVREARAQEALARASYLPTIDAGVGGATSRSVSAFGTPLEQTAAQPQIQISYELDLFGAAADRKHAAHQAYLASEAASDATRLAVASAVASGYITLRALDARLDVARQTLAARADSLRVARSRTSAGFSPMLELRQAEAEYDATAALIPQLATTTRQEEDALSVLIGRAPGPIPRGRPLASLAEPTIPAMLPSDLLDRRPDIAQAEAQLAATDAGLAAARKRFLPHIELGATGGAAISTLLADPITLFSVGGSVLAPIFEGGALHAQAESAAARRDQAAYLYRRTVLNAFRETEDALATAQHLAQQRQLVTAQRDALAAALQLATNRYRAGYSPFLEQLDAERGLLAAQLTVIDVDADILESRVLLYRALGGGWDASTLHLASRP